MANRDAIALDDPVGASLRGHHAHHARRLGRAATYQPDVATFSAVSADPDPQEWADLARLLGRGELADMFSRATVPPPDWEPVFVLEGRQMTWSGGGRRPAETGTEVVELGRDSVPEMLDLVARAKPGPPPPRHAGEAMPPAWSVRSSPGSWLVTNVPSYMWPRRTPARSPSTSGSDSRPASP